VRDEVHAFSVSRLSGLNELPKAAVDLKADDISDFLEVKG
jgi:hypothetical protein